MKQPLQFKDEIWPTSDPGPTLPALPAQTSCHHFCGRKSKKKQQAYNDFASTLPETNIAPENGPSQKETSIPTIHFQVLC